MPIRSSLLVLLFLSGCGSSMRLSDGQTSRVIEPHSAFQGELGGLRFKRDVCSGIDLRPDYELHKEQNLIEFLEGQGLRPILVERARPDLVYVTYRVEGASEPVKLRIAILPTPIDAGYELHHAILQHGTNSWGVHRSNLAVLGPMGASAEDAMVFAAKTRLSCWGVFTVGGRDDTFVVPGGYAEL